MPALCSGLSLRSSPKHSAFPSLYLVQQAATDRPELTATSGPSLLAKLTEYNQAISPAHTSELWVIKRNSGRLLIARSAAVLG